MCLPHIRGGVSFLICQDGSGVRVCPTHVGVFRPVTGITAPLCIVLPTHVGVIRGTTTATITATVLPTHVGVFR